MRERQRGFVGASPVQGEGDAPQVFRAGRSSLTLSQGVRHLRLDEPDAFHAGLATGRLLVASGDAMVRLLRLPGLGWAARLACFIARRHFARVTVPPAAHDELRGLAQGTGIAWHCLFFVNFVFDVAKRYGFHCSTLVFFQGDTVLVGRNTDLLPGLAAVALRFIRPLVVEVRLPGQARYAHVSVPCFIGVLNGCNEHGIAVHSHQVVHVAEQPDGPRLASSLLMRTLLEGADSLAAAADIARAHPTVRSLNVVVASAREQLGLVLEVHPDQVHVLDRAGAFGCATHFASPAMCRRHDGPVAASEARLASMQALIAAHPRPDRPMLTTMLTDCRNGLLHRLSGRSISNEGTFQSFVIDVAQGTVWVSNGVRRPVSTSGVPVEVRLGTGGAGGGSAKGAGAGTGPRPATATATTMGLAARWGAGAQPGALGASKEGR
jgi:predicted choloylglycine hydrolase